jgi:hypothetical protein
MTFDQLIFGQMTQRRVMERTVYAAWGWVDSIDACMLHARLRIGWKQRYLHFILQTYIERTEAIYLVIRDPSMNEL